MKNNNTVFNQMLQLISRYEFEKAVQLYKTNKYSKGFSSWDHFVSLMFAQLSKQNGLRGVESGMNSFTKKLYHLGTKPVKRSTLSYANNKRNHHVFKALFEYKLAETLKNAPGHKFRFKNDLYSFDATIIDLCLSLHDWAAFRKTKGGIKLHVKLNHKGYLPEFVTLTTAKQHEVNILKRISFKPGDVVVYDRGLVDYRVFATHCRERIYFVTRLKSNAEYRVIGRKDVSKYKHISSDQIIEFTVYTSKKKCPLRLRRIRSRDPETGKYIVLLTNHFEWSPQTIALIYKDRWKIEIFFKTIKQNLRIKSFLGTSKNAILCQIWVALIVYLLLSYMSFLSKHSWSINKLMNVIPILLFSRIDLWTWLHNPFDCEKPSNLNLYQGVLF
jgi:IS4 transposase